MPETYRSIKCRVFTSDMKHSEVFTLYPPPGKLWTKEALLIKVSEFVWGLKEQFPGNDFQVIRKGNGRFNFIPFALQQAADSAEEKECLQLQ